MIGTQKNFKPKVIAIVGPTASGKSSLAIYLAQKIEDLKLKKAEIISADSRQVYRGLTIGTGKVTKKEMRGIPHHLLDVADPKKQFSASDFTQLAKKACSNIFNLPGRQAGNKRIPIVVGGTGFYVDSLLGRIRFPEVPPDKKLRARLEKRSILYLFQILEKKDPRRAKTIDRGNKRRIIRALEIVEALGVTPIGGVSLSTTGEYDVLWIGINTQEKILHQNIRRRLLERIKDGMVEEAITLHKKGLSYKRMEELGLEYRFLSHLLQNKISKEAFVEELDLAIQKYAKRQMRWFKRNHDIHWVTSKTEVLRLVKQFLQ